MNQTSKTIAATAFAASFAFFGLFGSDKDQEYGAYTHELHVTMAQALPPYHETADSTQTREETGQAPVANAPAAPNPPAAAEQTPKVQ